ncbi:MAG: hypothetical protein R3213_04290 [Flavobacteriaceae bacterium]|nr:hypothetical protein [Flavobacteriaceae bacterium]
MILTTYFSFARLFINLGLSLSYLIQSVLKKVLYFTHQGLAESMKYVYFLLMFNIYGLISAQNIDLYEKPPVFPGCEDQSIENLKACFQNKLNLFIYENFKVPQKVFDDNYKGEVQVLFEVSKDGELNILYIDAVYEELKEELKRVFETIPEVKPGTYNSKPTYFQYSFSFNIPLSNPGDFSALVRGSAEVSDVNQFEDEMSTEFDSITASLKPYTQLEYSSNLNIPFTHNFYTRFEDNMNVVGTNSHTASKPFLYQDVSKYYDFQAEKEKLLKQTNTWWGRKLWNEHLVRIQSEDYWFVVDPIFDLQIGVDTDADFNTTFNNTRGFIVQGGLGKNFNFSTSVYESQGRFARYYNEYAESLKAFGPDPAIIPGRGIAKEFKENAYDYPVAEAYLSYSPAKFLNVQFGHGKNFIGDGYRSLFQSDFASPHTFLKLNTNFWKIKYTNTWMWLSDVRPEVVE